MNLSMGSVEQLISLNEQGRLPVSCLPEWQAWYDMHGRCSNPNLASYWYYGNREISVCPGWNDFWTFLMDIGRRPSREHSLNRIDNDGNYEPSNCEWATKRNQMLNRRGTKCSPEIAAAIRSLPSDIPLVDIAEAFGIAPQTVSSILCNDRWTDRDYRPVRRKASMPWPKPVGRLERRL
jgi:hypothetical protein